MVVAAAAQCSVLGYYFYCTFLSLNESRLTVEDCRINAGGSGIRSGRRVLGAFCAFTVRLLNRTTAGEFPRVPALGPSSASEIV